MFCAEAMAAEARATSSMRVLSSVTWDKTSTKNIEAIQKNKNVQIIESKSNEKKVLEIVF